MKTAIINFGDFSIMVIISGMEDPDTAEYHVVAFDTSKTGFIGTANGNFNWDAVGE